MKKLLCLILAIVMLAALAACDRGKQPAATYNDAGFYTLDSLTTADGTTTGAELYARAREVTLELTDGGTGLLTSGEDLVILSWRDGFVTDDTGTHAYVRENGKLTLDMSEGNDILVMTFVEGAVDYAALLPDEPAEPAPDEPAGPAEDSPVGSYRLLSMNNGDESVTGEEMALMESLGITFRLNLCEDGTGVLVIYGEETPLTWDDTSLIVDDDPAEYVYDGRTLTIYADGVAFMTFEKTGTAPAAGPDEGQAAEAPAPRVSDYTPVSGTLGENGEFEVSILGAERFTDVNGGDAVRFYYSFTNNGDEPTWAWNELFYDALEDGAALEGTYAFSDDDVDEYGNETLSIQPGVTLLCIEEYAFRPDGTELTLRLSDYDDNELVAVFDPGALPGRPAAMPIEPIADPQFYLDYPSAGTGEGYTLSIDGAELVKGYDWGNSEQVLRVFFTYENTSDDPSSCWWDTYLIAYQDGVQLPYGYPEEDTDTDALFDADVEPGQTVTCSRSWGVRSDSPVEVVAMDGSGGVLCAGTISLAD